MCGVEVVVGEAGSGEIEVEDDAIGGNVGEGEELVTEVEEGCGGVDVDGVTRVSVTGGAMQRRHIVETFTTRFNAKAM